MQHFYFNDEVAEISGMEGNKPRLNPIWKYEPAHDAIVETGVPSKFRETLCASAGIRPSDFEAHVQQREQILLDLQAQGVRGIEQVTKVFQSYYSSNRWFCYFQTAGALSSQKIRLPYS